MDQIQLHGENKEIVDELVKLSKDYGIMTPYTSFLADETTQLSRPGELHERMEAEAKSMAGDISGGAGQRAAMARQSLNLAARAPSGTGKFGGGVAMYGNVKKDAYEAGKVETVSNLRQIGNQAIYRRGKVWVAANASEIDLERDAQKVQNIERFSDEYFKLVRENSVEDNQVLASQAAGEELVIKLRGQVYRIK
jgi:Ca-activated chloride channel family protein